MPAVVSGMPQIDVPGLASGLDRGIVLPRPRVEAERHCMLVMWRLDRPRARRKLFDRPAPSGVESARR